MVPGGGGGEEEGDPTNRRGRRCCPGGRTHVLKTIINMCVKVCQKNIYYDYILYYWELTLTFSGTQAVNAMGGGAAKADE